MMEEYLLEDSGLLTEVQNFGFSNSSNTGGSTLYSPFICRKNEYLIGKDL